MVDALHHISIALVDRIHTQILRLAIGFGLTAFVKPGDLGAGLVKVLANALVGGAMSQDIQLYHGDAWQPGILRLSN